MVSGIKHQLWGSWTKVCVSTLPFISYEILGKVFNLANIFLISKMDIITALALESRAVVKTEQTVLYKTLILQCLAYTKHSINVRYKY